MTLFELYMIGAQSLVCPTCIGSPSRDCCEADMME